MPWCAAPWHTHHTVPNCTTYHTYQTVPYNTIICIYLYIILIYCNTLVQFFPTDYNAAQLIKQSPQYVTTESNSKSCIDNSCQYYVLQCSWPQHKATHLHRLKYAARQRSTTNVMQWWMKCTEMPLAVWCTVIHNCLCALPIKPGI